jgi:hypothetical protein
MILDIQSIKDIILNNPNKDMVAKSVSINKKLRTHLFGEGLTEHIKKIAGKEYEHDHVLRKQYSKSNKDLFARLGRPIDKVFSARGGSVYYYLTESQNKRAMQLASDVRDGYALKKWLQSVFLPYYLSDPNGLIFLEIGNGINYEDGKAYPTYKSITTIYDYSVRGTSLDYIVFHVTKEEKEAAGFKASDKIFRVVDDAFDRYVLLKGKEVTEIENQTYPNYFGYVPGIINSDFLDPLHGNKASLYDDVLELAEHFLYKGSIKVTHDFLHAFPKYWEYASKCGACQGEGRMEGVSCDHCNGTGYAALTNVAKMKLLPYPESNDAPKVAPDVAGYISPDVDYYEIATDELKALEDAMTFTLWGSHKAETPAENGRDVTATERFIDTQPVNERLSLISESFEKRHKFVIDSMIKISINPSYKGASVNYGRRYMIESPDEIFVRYSDARTKGAPNAVLDELLIEFIEAKYNGDPVSMDIMLKLMYVEPFVHKTEEQVKALGLDPQDYLAKVYFNEWKATLQENIIIDNNNDIQALRDMLYDYVSGKKLAPEPVKQAA